MTVAGFMGWFVLIGMFPVDLASTGLVFIGIGFPYLDSDIIRLLRTGVTKSVVGHVSKTNIHVTTFRLSENQPSGISNALAA